MSSTAVAGTSVCILEPRPHIWDLGGTMTATFADKSNPDEPVGFINSDQVLQVTVTVTLTGNVLNYLCDTSMCVCLAFEACGCGPSGDYCEWIELTGDYSPCRTHEWKFVIDVPAWHVQPGRVRTESITSASPWARRTAAARSGSSTAAATRTPSPWCRRRRTDQPADVIPAGSAARIWW